MKYTKKLCRENMHRKKLHRKNYDRNLKTSICDSQKLHFGRNWKSMKK